MTSDGGNTWVDLVDRGRLWDALATMSTLHVSPCAYFASGIEPSPNLRDAIDPHDPVLVLHDHADEGLHGAIAREIGQDNPHAVFPLIRAFAESVILVMYVSDHPRYVETLTARPSELRKNGPKRKSIQSLINTASKRAPGMKDVYAELSEATHFGAIAMWASHAIEGDDESGYRTSWASYPRWRNDEQALVACAQTLELTYAMEFFLRQFCDRHVLPLKPPAR